MAYTREDMRKIFRDGILLGLMRERADIDTCAARDEIAAESFEPSLLAIRQGKVKAKPDDTGKAIKEWEQAGSPKGWGMIAELFPEDESEPPQKSAKADTSK